MKVIIDTSIVVSAALKNRDPEVVVLFVVEHPDFQWVASPAILKEYFDVLHQPKFRLPAEVLQKWGDLFNALITVVEVRERINFPRDQKDAKFLECALATNAEYLITGDKDFSEAYKVVSTTVLSVSLFKTRVCDVW